MLRVQAATWMPGCPPEVFERLRRRFQGKTFTFGYIGYAPFTSADGEGPVTETLRAVCSLLNAEPKAVRTTWESFHQQIIDGEILTLVDPVFPSMDRHFNVVPYAQIRSCVVLHHEKYRGLIADTARKIDDVRDNWRYGGTMTGRTMALNALVRVGDGFASCRHTAEADNLNAFRVNFKELPATDITRAAIDAVGSNHLVVLDYPSAFNALQQLSDLNESKFMISDLLDGSEPVLLFAGLPALPEDADLQTLMVSLNGALGSRLANLDHQVLTKMGVDLIWNRPERPTIVPTSMIPYWMSIEGHPAISNAELVQDRIEESKILHRILESVAVTLAILLGTLLVTFNTSSAHVFVGTSWVTFLLIWILVWKSQTTKTPWAKAALIVAGFLVAYEVLIVFNAIAVGGKNG